jgi:hypothetical protein
MEGLMIHTDDGLDASFGDLCKIPVPMATSTYHPVAHKELIHFVRERIDATLGMTIKNERYGLSRKAQDGHRQQMFGVITLDAGNDENGLSIGLRNSYDKSLSVGISSGAKVFVCDNLCFSGDAMVVLRKHTLNVWRDISLNVDKALRESEGHYIEMNRQLEAMKHIPVSYDAGGDLVGRAMLYEVLKPQQATVTLRDWRKPRHEAFAERNLYSLYNCFTQGLKKGQAGESMDRHATTHDFFAPMVPVAPTTITITQ